MRVGKVASLQCRQCSHEGVCNRLDEVTKRTNRARKAFGSIPGVQLVLDVECADIKKVQRS